MPLVSVEIATVARLRENPCKHPYVRAMLHLVLWRVELV